jgi:hypothetical protein
VDMGRDVYIHLQGVQTGKTLAQSKSSITTNQNQILMDSD